MADALSGLPVTETAIDKIGARRITIEEGRQLPRNANVTVQDPHHDPPGKRRLLIGGWDAADRERRILAS